MANFFPRSTNFLPFKIAFCLGLLGLGVALAIPYYFTPKYTRVGYTPDQPVPFDHSWHAGQLGLDCRYCHSHVESSGHSNIPTNETCYNCHGPGKGQIKVDSPKLAAVRESGETGKPIEWVRVHAAPDYVYFNHSVHVARGVSCVSCHGKVNEMKVVGHAEPHSMGWCLDCHRNPEKHLRPVDQVYNLDYDPAKDVDRKSFYAELLSEGVEASEIVGSELPEGQDPLEAVLDWAQGEFGDTVAQKEVGAQLKAHWQVSPPESCAACHR
jgi:hypothetical protein